MEEEGELERRKRKRRRRRRRRRSRARAMRLLHHLLHAVSLHAEDGTRYTVLGLRGDTICSLSIASVYTYIYIYIPTAVPMQAYLAYVMFYRFSQSHRFIMISVSRVPRTPCARSSRFYRDTFSSVPFFMIPFFEIYTYTRKYSSIRFWNIEQ